MHFKSKNIIIVLVFFLTASLSAFAEYPPEGWIDSITEGIARAEDEGKMLLLDFTGSDWCVWCQKLSTEVWNTPEFEAWSEDNLIKVFLDFPRTFTLPDDRVMQNQLLQQYFGVQGYPTIFLLDSNLNPLLKTGYHQGGPEEYIRHLKEDRNLRVDSPEEFRTSFRGVIEKYIGPIE
jgi:protein disulfide-isomerase